MKCQILKIIKKKTTPQTPPKNKKKGSPTYNLQLTMKYRVATMTSLSMKKFFFVSADKRHSIHTNIALLIILDQHKYKATIKLIFYLKFLG